MEDFNKVWRHLSKHYRTRDGGGHTTATLPVQSIYMRICDSYNEALMGK